MGVLQGVMGHDPGLEYALAMFMRFPSDRLRFSPGL